jgi:hypothetical protein
MYRVTLALALCVSLHSIANAVWSDRVLVMLETNASTQEEFLNQKDSLSLVGFAPRHVFPPNIMIGTMSRQFLPRLDTSELVTSFVSSNRRRGDNLTQFPVYASHVYEQLTDRSRRRSARINSMPGLLEPPSCLPDDPPFSLTLV